MALCDRAGIHRTSALRLIASLFSAGLVATLAGSLVRRMGNCGAVLALPLVMSLYFVTSAAWLLPDNLAWWGVLGGILLALHPPAGLRWYVSATAILLGLVVVRQSNLWVAAPIWISAALGGHPGTNPGEAMHGATRLGMPRRILLAMLATLPAILLLGYFLVLWHGLTPPMFQSGTVAEGATAHAGGYNPAAPAFILSLVAGFGLFYFPLYSGLPVGRAAWRAILLGCVLGLILGVAPHTSYDYDAGRRSGLWELVGHLPTFLNRSPLIVLLSTIGGGVLVFMICMLGEREKWILATVWAAFVFAQTANRVAWQRYYEPFVLIVLPLMLVMAMSQHQSKPPRWAWLGPAVLSLLLAGITAASMHR
jgi:hypothetical protein